MKPSQQASRARKTRAAVATVVLALAVGGGGCAGLGIPTQPTVSDELRREWITVGDLWVARESPRTEMEPHYGVPAGGDLWMSPDADETWSGAREETADRELPPRLERLLDLMKPGLPE